MQKDLPKFDLGSVIIFFNGMYGLTIVGNRPILKQKIQQVSNLLDFFVRPLFPANLLLLSKVTIDKLKIY